MYFAIGIGAKLALGVTSISKQRAAPLSGTFLQGKNIGDEEANLINSGISNGSSRKTSSSGKKNSSKRQRGTSPATKIVENSNNESATLIPGEVLDSIESLKTNDIMNNIDVLNSLSGDEFIPQNLSEELFGNVPPG